MPQRSYYIPQGYYYNVFPYEVTPEMAMGLVWQSLPEAFLTGLDIARALQQEKWQRQQYEYQRKYTEGANLLNAFFNALSQGVPVEDAKKMIPEQRKKEIAQIFGIDINQLSIPTVETLYPQADYSLVGEKVKGLAYPFSQYFTVLPGSAVKDILGSELTTPTGETIKIKDTAQYLVPATYSTMWGKQKQFELGRTKLMMALDKVKDDEKLKAIDRALNLAQRYLQMGNIEEARKIVKNITESVAGIYKEKTGYDINFDDLLIEQADKGWLEIIVDTIRSWFTPKNISQKKGTVSQQGGGNKSDWFRVYPSTTTIQR